VSKSSEIGKVIACSFGAAVVASMSVLFVGACVFGFRFAEWAEWEGRLVGLAGTVAGVAGAVVGLKIALRAQ
jgi:hypothetical protein